MPQESLQRLRKYHFSVLRMQGHTSVVYVDNYLEGDSCGSYLKNVNDTTIMLGALGFATDTKFNILRFYHKL